MSNLQIFAFSAALVILILLAAFFSCAETGLMAVNRYRLKTKARQKQRYAVRALQLLKRPDRILGTILIGSTFANMLAASLATLLANHYFGDKGAFLVAILLTLVMLIFGEVTPKTLAALNPDKVVRYTVFPVEFMMHIIYPIVWFANANTNFILKLFKIRMTNLALEPLSREELRSVVYDTTGKISRQYQNMLLSILDLNKLTVDDIMIPRHDLVGIDIEAPWEKILEKLIHFKQDWVPVYREHLDKLIGVLYIHDLLKVLATDKNKIDKELFQQLLHEPYFVPAGTSLSTQLTYFQQGENKLAFIVDEYGEIQGLLTLNAILEEIVGDLTTSVNMGRKIVQQSDGSYLVDGAVTVREFNRKTNWNLPLRGPRTINGLIVEYLEALPHINSAVLIGGYPIEIIQVKENRVKLARIFPKRENH